jgi:hypothetical protein
MSQVKMIIVSWRLLLMAALAGCGRFSPNPAGPIDSLEPVAASLLPQPNRPTIKPHRVITIRALDNEYQGSTAIRPDNRLDHQKGSHD